MTLLILQITLITTIAVAAGILIGWWGHIYYSRGTLLGLKKELEQVKVYFTDSLKENSRTKLQLKLADEKLDMLSKSKHVVEGIDFEAYKVFENTVKEAQMRKYLN